MIRGRFLSIFGLSLLGAFLTVMANLYVLDASIFRLIPVDPAAQIVIGVIILLYGTTILPIALLCLRCKSLRYVAPIGFGVITVLTCVVTAFSSNIDLGIWYWLIQWLIAALVLVAIRRTAPDAGDDYVENYPRGL